VLNAGSAREEEILAASPPPGKFSLILFKMNRLMAFLED
jgi:hypothetical protein